MNDSIDYSETAATPNPTPVDWLKLAQEAHLSSKSYFDASIRRQVERGLRLFQSKHPEGSKYLSDPYKLRSKHFRPKTRTVIRKNMAAAADAFFSTDDQISIQPNDETNPMQRMSADVIGALVEMRLKKSIPWYMLVLGAYQDAQVNGACISYQYWDYDAVKKRDCPCVELRPIENVRIDPGASWVDPIGTTPYIIDEIPMYVKDVRARMVPGADGQSRWKPMTDAQLIAASGATSMDSTRLVREQGRQDPKTVTSTITAFDTVWVHRNIINYNGQDWFFYSLGTVGLLSDPIPLEQAYLHGKRPYAMGICEIEAHRNYPSGITHLGENLQVAINDLDNRLHDLLAQLLNKRYLVKRDKQVDIRSLTRSVTGVTLVDDIDDVKWMDSPDINPGAFSSMDRMNLDFDDITGSFSQSTINSNRNMNETVGLGVLGKEDSNQVSGLTLRTFVVTWVEPVLRQLVELERFYETDDALIYTVGAKAGLLKQMNQAIPAAIFEQELTVSVNVGMGATNPAVKLQRLLGALQGLRESLSDNVLTENGLNVGELIKEVMGFAGYKDGARFFDEKQDPRIDQLTAQIGELQQKLAAKAPPELIQAQIAKMQKEMELIDEQRKKTGAERVNVGVDAFYAAMQAAGVLSAAPQIAPIADVVMQESGYVPPNPAGVDPHVLDNASGMATGTGTPATSNTDPLTPNPPASPQVGEDAGIKTQAL